MFDQIEKLKQDYTDKYVVVDAGIPELARFAGHVGQVKTVNMSGRALVEFDAWSNIGWYDIEIDCLQVVPKPDPKAEAPAKREAPAKPVAKAAAAPAGEKKLSPLEMARMQGAAKKPGDASAAAPAGAKKSTADILAAARAAKSAPSDAQAPAAAKSAPGAKMSTADILAAARAKNAAETQTAPAAQAAAVEAPATSTQPAAEETADESPPQAAAAKPAAKAPAFAKGQRPSVSEILAWCREHDAK
jgi:hypothetical protein